jgi:hypothetical protein
MSEQGSSNSETSQSPWLKNQAEVMDGKTVKAALTDMQRHGAPVVGIPIKLPVETSHVSPVVEATEKGSLPVVVSTPELDKPAKPKSPAFIAFFRDVFKAKSSQR